MPLNPENQTTSEPASGRVLTSLRQLRGHQFHGEYLLEEVIGEGAMGVVFRAVQKGLGRKVALKLMKGDVLRDQEEVVERFASEIQIVANLSHPNIIRLFDSGYEPNFGVYYVAMELIEGLCLGDLLRTHRCHPSLALEVTAQICRGLTEPHQLGVVHRDLKPDNIFLRLRSDGELEVKILDFGIACALHNNARITRTGMLMGTPAYMAPELAISSPITTRTDLYALGIMLFEMLTGDVPHQDETPLKILMRHIHTPVATLGSIDPELDIPGLQPLLDALLQKASNDRPASALMVCKELEAIQRAQGLELAKLNPHATIEAAIEPLVTLSAQTKETLHRIQSSQLIERPNQTDPTHALLGQQGGAALVQESDAGFGAPKEAALADVRLLDDEDAKLSGRRPRASRIALLCGLAILCGLGFFTVRPLVTTPAPLVAQAENQQPPALVSDGSERIETPGSEVAVPTASHHVIPTPDVEHMRAQATAKSAPVAEEDNEQAGEPEPKASRSSRKPKRPAKVIEAPPAHEPTPLVAATGQPKGDEAHSADHEASAPPPSEEEAKKERALQKGLQWIKSDL